MALDAKFNRSTGQIEYQPGGTGSGFNVVFGPPHSEHGAMICSGDSIVFVPFEAILQYALAHASRARVMEWLRENREEEK